MVGQGTGAPICCLWVHAHRSLLCVILIFPTSVEKRDGNEFFVLLVVSFGITVKSNTVLSSVFTGFSIPGLSHVCMYVCMYVDDTTQ